MTPPRVGGLLLACILMVDGPISRASPPQLRTLDRQDLVDMMVGTSILCTRGGDTEGMIKRIDDALAAGRQFTMIALEDVPDDWMAFTSFGVGGGGAWSHVTERMERQGFVRGRPVDPSLPTAIDVLSQYMGRTFDVTFEAEAGGATSSALLTASRMSIPIVDGCPSGRCLPEVQMSPFFMNGISRAPLAATTRYGDSILIPRVHDDFRVEDLTRALAVASGGSVTVAANAVSGKVLKANLIPGFLSKAILLGRAARRAVAAGDDPVRAVIDAGDGYLLFRGTVTQSESKGEQGFGWTDAVLEGTGGFVGSRYRIFNKNENMVAWRDGRLDASAPDLIAALDARTGWAMRGGSIIGSFVVGQELAIVGFRNHAIWRTPKAIEMLGPRHFGFDHDYIPIERLHASR
ncbi:MAG: DUF917 domain-containing protein [Acidobacteria bacterium]|nr:DUF917 domain-containing protein [Acidobacteriota bacterium]